LALPPPAADGDRTQCRSSRFFELVKRKRELGLPTGGLGRLPFACINYGPAARQRVSFSFTLTESDGRSGWRGPVQPLTEFHQ